VNIDDRNLGNMGCPSRTSSSMRYLAEYSRCNAWWYIQV